MFAVCIAMVKNEADIVEAFCRHTVRFFDLMVVIDNGSVDRTREILVELEREGLPVVVADEPDFAYRQSQRMTRAFRNVCHALRPDFVMLLDADEFLRADSPEVFRQALSTIPAGACGLVPWVSYVCPPSAPEHANPLRYMTRRLGAEARAFDKVVVSVPGDRFGTLTITQGNHVVVASEGEVGHVPLRGVALGHFPVRSPGQLAAKVIVGHMAYVAHRPGDERLGYQWHSAYHRLMRTGPPSWAEVSETSLDYLGQRHEGGYAEATVEDPVPVDFKLRHGAGGDDPLVVVARSWEAQLRQAQSGDAAGQRPAPAAVAGNGAEPARHPCDLPPLTFLMDKHRPRSVADFACGTGSYLAHARERGAERVLGIGPLDPSATVLGAGEHVRADAARGIDLGETFDLVLYPGATGELTVHELQGVIADLARHANALILFAPEAGGAHRSRGPGDLPFEEWQRRWAGLGWHLHGPDTLGVRALATLPWLMRNAMVLSRTPPDPPHHVDALKAIEATRWRPWTPAAPAISTAFRESPPAGAGARW